MDGENKEEDKNEDPNLNTDGTKSTKAGEEQNSSSGTAKSRKLNTGSSNKRSAKIKA